MFWAFLAVTLIAVGFLLGTILSIIIWFVITGILNRRIAKLLWDLECNPKWTSSLGQGFLLELLFIFVRIPFIGLDLEYGSFLGYLLALFIFLTFIYGVIGRAIAGMFPLTYTIRGVIVEPISEEDKVIQPTRAVSGVCPECSIENWFDASVITEDGTVMCKGCGERFTLETPEAVDDGLAPE